MRILIACVHYSVSSGRYITRALTRLGHDVRTVGPAPGRMIWGLEIDQKWAWQPTYGLTDAHQLLEGTWTPELVITADSAFTLSGRMPGPHVLWGVDNHVRDYQMPGAVWDQMFFAHSWGQRIGEPNAHWLPPGYDPEAHRALGLAERDIDVALVGNPYPERVAILEGMRAAGLNVLGSIGALWDAYNAIYNRAKIALVRSVAGDLTQRFLENMAQGCCVLADRVVDAHQLGFVPYVHYWPFDDAEDATRQARHLLASGAWRAVAAAGQQFVQGHTWDQRAVQMLTTVFPDLPQLKG